jgi:hypothetical protein
MTGIMNSNSEPVFVHPLRSPGIDSKPGGPVRQPFYSYRPARLHKPAQSMLRNRFLGSLNIYKYRFRRYREPLLPLFRCKQSVRRRMFLSVGEKMHRPWQPMPKMTLTPLHTVADCNSRKSTKNFWALCSLTFP